MKSVKPQLKEEEIEAARRNKENVVTFIISSGNFSCPIKR
jgi:hypothetical protein